MSDTPQGENWRRASDGRWYPPEQQPDYRQLADLPDPPALGHGRATRSSSTAEDAPPVPVLTPETNGMAIAALVMAVMGYVLVGFGTLFAILFAVAALRQLRREDSQERGRGLAQAALILSLLQVLLVVAVLVLAATYLAAQAAGSALEDLGDEIELQMDCRAERRAMHAAAEQYRKDNDEYPTSALQVEEYLDIPVSNFDFDDSGSGRLTSTTSVCAARGEISYGVVAGLLAVPVVIAAAVLVRKRRSISHR